MFTEEQLAQIATDVFACCQYPMLVTDGNGIIVAANKSFTTTSGWQTTELIGQSMSIVHSGRHDDAFYRCMWEKLEKDGNWTGEIWNKTKDGHAFHACLAIMAAHNGQSSPTNYIAVYCDVDKYLSISQNSNDQTDSLTGLLTRQTILKRLKTQISGRNHNSMCASLFLDLGHLHSITESFGNKVGDQLLLAVSQKLSACVRSIDSVGRWSDDAFVIILPDVSNEIAEKVAARILNTISLPYNLEQHLLTVNFSIGISVYPWHGDEPELLIQNACKAMIAAREQAHKKIEIYSGRD